MKTAIITALLITLPAFGQVVPINVGNYAGDPSGEQIGRQLMLKLNYNLLYLQAQVTNLQAQLTALQSQTSPSNQVYSTTLTTLLSTNPYIFSGSNYLGRFTNVYSIADTAQHAGTNYALTNIMSLDGTTWLSFAPTNYQIQVVLTNWFTNQVVTNYLTSTNIGTNTYYISHLGTNFIATNQIYTNYANGGVHLSVLSPSLSSTGSVTVKALSPNSLWGRFNGFAGQSVDFADSTIAGTYSGKIAVLTPAGANWMIFTNGLLIQTNSYP